MNPLLSQSGIGIAFRQGSLRASYCKRFWKGFREVDRLEIPDYQSQGAGECGKIYRQFLHRNGLKSPWTVVALPRAQVLLRMVRFPRAMQKELSPAIEYQLDSLHPFAEGSVVWDHSVWNAGALAKSQPPKQSGAAAEPKEIDVLVAMAQKTYIEGLADWFREEGIPISQFCPTTTLLLNFLSASIQDRIASGEPYFLAHRTKESVELIGCAVGDRFVSREIPVATSPEIDESELAELLSRNLEQARAEMRLAPVERPLVHWCGMAIPPALGADRGELPFRIIPAAADAAGGDSVVDVAAAYTAVHRNGRPSLNLLPQASRSYESPLALLPTYALAGVVVLLAISMGLRGSVQDWTYARYLERERQALLPEIQQIENLQTENQEAMARLATLASLRRSGALPLDLLEELTRTLPADAWLQQLQYEGSAVSLSGTAQSASAVLQAVSASNFLEKAQFTAALTRTPEGKEVFRIGARLRIPNP